MSLHFFLITAATAIYVDFPHRQQFLTSKLGISVKCGDDCPKTNLMVQNLPDVWLSFIFRLFYQALELWTVLSDIFGDIKLVTFKFNFNILNTFIYYIKFAMFP